MAEAKTKKKEIGNQHYVPRSYLKRFTHDGKKFFIFDKFTRKCFESNIKRIANEKYFYDFPEGIGIKDEDLQIVEKELGKLDSKFPILVDDVLRTLDERGEITHIQKTNMAYFIAIQLLRTREHRNFRVELGEKMGEVLLHLIIETNKLNVSPDEYEIEFSQETAKFEQIASIFNPKNVSEFAKTLDNHIWIIGINDTTHPVYTSDNPVVMYPNKEGSGLASEGIEIAFPLTPKYILMILERTFFKSLEALDCKPTYLRDGDLFLYNSSQVFQSYRQVYCQSNDFSLAEKICEEVPEACNPDRNRIS